MSPLSDDPIGLASHLRRAALAAAIGIGVMALVVLAGWWADVSVLTSVVPGFVTMKAATAVGFLASSLVLAKSASNSEGAVARQGSTLAASFVMLLGIVTLVEWATHHSFGLSAMLTPGASENPGTGDDAYRMSVPTAACFACFGLAGLLQSIPRLRALSDRLLEAVLLAGALSFSGYVFGERSLFLVSSHTSMAVHTSLAFMVLGLAGILARCDRGFGALVAGVGLGSTLLRRALPISILVLGTTFWMRLAGERMGFYGTEFGIAIMFVSTSLLLAVGIGWGARHLNRIEVNSREAQAKLQTLNAEIARGLHESEERAQLATEAAMIGVWDWNLTTNQVVWDEQMHTLYGLPLTSSLKVSFQTWVDAVHPGDIEQQLAILQSTVRNGGRSDRTFRIRRATDGGVRHIHAIERVVLDAATGRPIRVVGVNRDITESRAQEQSLRDSLRQITAFKTALDGCAIVALTDTQGTITAVNDNFCKISGYRREDLIGQNHRLLNSGHHPPEFFQDLWRTIGQGKAWRAEICNRTKHGSLYWVDTTIAPLLGENGKPTQYLALRFDITSVKQLEINLKSARDEAMEASRLKSEFLATMSHEIRTPMNAIIGMSGLLAETNLDEDQAEMVHTVGNGAESLLAIINDILDFSKIEAGELRLELADFDLQACIEDTLSMLAPRAHQKGIELAANFTFSPECLVRGDRSRLRQVLLNLIGNAVKFTDRGEVTVALHRIVETAELIHLRIEVADTGIGMDESAQRHLFQPFMQADGSITRRFGGTGLGLAITRKLVHAMSGEIGAQSRLNEGSTFWVELKLERREALQKSTGASLFTGLRVLVVDDNLTNQNILVSQLRKHGMQTGAADGPEALAQLVAPGHSPWDIILLDWNMPRLSGQDFLLQLGHQPNFTAPPVIVLSSAGVGPKVETAGHTVVHAFLTKPVLESKLLRCISEALGDSKPKKATRSFTPKAPRPFAGRSLHLLLVEDNLPNQRVGSLLLAKMGHSVVIENNGQLALERLAREKFDAVLMDCQMPVMDGFEATRRIRDGTATGVDPYIPIIALTAYARAEDQERCEEAGMNDYLSKPIRPTELTRVLEGLIPRPADIPPPV